MSTGPVDRRGYARGCTRGGTRGSTRDVCRRCNRCRHRSWSGVVAVPQHRLDPGPARVGTHGHNRRHHHHQDAASSNVPVTQCTVSFVELKAISTALAR